MDPPPPRIRLQVHVHTASAGQTDKPVSSFIEVAFPSASLEDLSLAITNRHRRLYPHKPPLQIYRIQDSECNDLDLSYTVADVFSDKTANKDASVVRVVQAPNHRDASIPPDSGLRSHQWQSLQRPSHPRLAGIAQERSFRRSPAGRPTQRILKSVENDMIVEDSADERDENHFGGQRGQETSPSRLSPELGEETLGRMSVQRTRSRQQEDESGDEDGALEDDMEDIHREDSGTESDQEPTRERRVQVKREPGFPATTPRAIAPVTPRTGGATITRNKAGRAVFNPTPTGSPTSGRRSSSFTQHLPHSRDIYDFPTSDDDEPGNTSYLQSLPRRKWPLTSSVRKSLSDGTPKPHGSAKKTLKTYGSAKKSLSFASAHNSPPPPPSQLQPPEVDEDGDVDMDRAPTSPGKLANSMQKPSAPTPSIEAVVNRWELEDEMQRQRMESQERSLEELASSQAVRTRSGARAKTQAEKKLELEQKKKEQEAEKARKKAEAEAEKARKKEEAEAERARKKEEAEAEKARKKAEAEAEKARKKTEAEAEKARQKAEAERIREESFQRTAAQLEKSKEFAAFVDIHPTFKPAEPSRQPSLSASASPKKRARSSLGLPVASSTPNGANSKRLRTRSPSATRSDVEMGPPAPNSSAKRSSLRKDSTIAVQKERRPSVSFAPELESSQVLPDSSFFQTTPTPAAPPRRHTPILPPAYEPRVVIHTSPKHVSPTVEEAPAKSSSKASTDESAKSSTPASNVEAPSKTPGPKKRASRKKAGAGPATVPSPNPDSSALAEESVNLKRTRRNKPKVYKSAEFIEDLDLGSDLEEDANRSVGVLQTQTDVQSQNEASPVATTPVQAEKPVTRTPILLPPSPTKKRALETAAIPAVTEENAPVVEKEKPVQNQTSNVPPKEAAVPKRTPIVPPTEASATKNTTPIVPPKEPVISKSTPIVPPKEAAVPKRTPIVPPTEASATKNTTPIVPQKEPAVSKSTPIVPPKEPSPPKRTPIVPPQDIPAPKTTSPTAPKKAAAATSPAVKISSSQTVPKDQPASKLLSGPHASSTSPPPKRTPQPCAVGPDESISEDETESSSEDEIPPRIFKKTPIEVPKDAPKPAPKAPSPAAAAPKPVPATAPSTTPIVPPKTTPAAPRIKQIPAAKPIVDVNPSSTDSFSESSSSDSDSDSPNNNPLLSFTRKSKPPPSAQKPPPSSAPPLKKPQLQKSIVSSPPPPPLSQTTITRRRLADLDAGPLPDVHDLHRGGSQPASTTASVPTKLANGKQKPVLSDSEESDDESSSEESSDDDNSSSSSDDDSDSDSSSTKPKKDKKQGIPKHKLAGQAKLAEKKKRRSTLGFGSRLIGCRRSSALGRSCEVVVELFRIYQHYHVTSAACCVMESYEECIPCGNVRWLVFAVLVLDWMEVAKARRGGEGGGNGYNLKGYCS
ncbi:hypothetical protein EX30DRAFT_362668 [Ascodesmis nigricans]|uniref:Nucleolar protein Dnt1-like N-terminal domain-containing protein n=1 Tax=Ascodesmis nigricans TaxID=341454 RepID=A0A4S2N206_9PEZI|nr:hypothetical protein EX30DRAFT_362668 [Ascodesmis nigricans]